MNTFFKTFGVSFVGFLFLLHSPLLVQAQETSGERIASFASDITIQPDGEVQIVETITYDFGDNERHGIFRTIPLGFTAKGQPGHTTIDVESVTDERGAGLTYDVTSDDPVNIKIGDADTLITGVHTYVITYVVRAGVGFFDAYDELYWNITGNAWDVPIESVRATFHLPASVPAQDLKLAQYCGRPGDQSSCGAFDHPSGDTVVFSMDSTLELTAGEEVTAAVGFPKNLVAAPTAADVAMATFNRIWFLPLPLLVSLLWYRKRFANWLKRRAYYRAHPIIAEYDAGTFDPLEAAILVNGRATSKDMTAVVIWLAIRGFLKITNEDDEFIFTKMKDAGAESKPYEQLFLDALHTERESELGKKFGLVTTKAIQTAKTSLFAREYLTKAPSTDLAASRFVSMFILLFLAINPGIFIWIFLGTGIGFAFSGACILIGLITLVFGPSPAFLHPKGFEAQRKLLGLKLYIRVAEKDRITFANAPEKTPALFEKLLPYAIVFGLEKKWAAEFEGIYSTPPSWYVGTGTAFSTTSLIHHVSSLTSVTQQAIAASVPSSSRSSWGGSSGSSGGGSSGGGGGGGGGGSW